MIWERIKLLATGKAEWCDADTGEVVEQHTLHWSTRWAIAGIHSYNWRWVRRFGKQDCGCTINPITRRRVLTHMDCPIHGLCRTNPCSCKSVIPIRAEPADKPNRCCENDCAACDPDGRC